MSWDETKKDRSGGCHFTPCPKNCLSCPYPECINNRPPVRGEDGVDRYVNLTDGAKEKNKMQTRYSVGDTVLVDAKVVKIEADKKGVKYFLSSEYWTGQNCVREEEIISKSSKKAPKALAKTEKASKKRQKQQKTAENGKELQKTEEIKEGQQDGKTGEVEEIGKASGRQQDSAGGRKPPAGSGEEAKAANRQQAAKRSSRPGKKAAANTALTALARELAELNR